MWLSSNPRGRWADGPPRPDILLDALLVPFLSPQDFSFPEEDESFLNSSSLLLLVYIVVVAILLLNVLMSMMNKVGE